MNRLIEEGGAILISILALSLLAWSLIGLKWMQLQREARDDGEWTDAALTQFAGGQLDAARAQCSAHPGLLARLFATALDVREHARGFRRRLEPVLQAEIASLHRHLDIIAAVGTVVPLLGLLGTVFGMVETFGVLTREGSVELDALTKGISHALLTTQAGLLIALPILLVHRLLRSRLDRRARAAEALLQALESTQRARSDRTLRRAG